MKVKLLSLIGMAFLLLSCTYEMYETDSDELSRITCVADNFIYENAVQTRSAADVSNPEAVAFQWSKNDVVGIFPNKGTQISFPMTDGAGASSATFDGGGWALKNGATYYAYYPYNWEYCESEDFKNKIPYTYIGQKAVYENQDGIVQLGAYDYMYTSASTPANGSVNFAFHHIGALARMEITFPTTATYTKLVISASEAVFPVKGTFDLAAETFALKSSELASSIEIDLENLVGAENEQKVVYFMLPPADCNGLETFTATLINSENVEYIVDIEKKNIESGKAYGWEYSLTDVIYPSEAVYEVDYTGGELQVAINANINYTVQIPEEASDWLSLIETKSIRTDYLTLCCTANDGLARNATVNLLNDSGVEVSSFDVVQKEVPCMITYTTTDGKPLLNGNIFNYSTLVGHKFENGKGQLIFNKKITNIGYQAFYNCSSLSSITIPSSVTSIGGSAFYYCTSLSNVTLPNSLISIESFAFADCTSLSSVTIPNSVTSIGVYAFYNCSSLSNVTLPNSLISIGGFAFVDCTSLSSVTIPNSVTTIGERVFIGCI